MPLASDQRRRAEAVLEASSRAASLADFLDVTLAALDEHLGFGVSAFMLVPTGSGRAYAGVEHRMPEQAMEEYFERWADADPLGCPVALAGFARDGWTSTESIYSRLDAPRRRFVDDFLRRIRTPHELSVRIPLAGTDAYVTVMGAEPFGREHLDLLALVAPELRALLRAWMPRGVDAALSQRERQVAELVALGFTNREIGEVLHIEEDTVKKHVSATLARLSLRHRTELGVVWATGRRLDLRPESSIRRN